MSVRNPVRAYKASARLTYRKLASQLGCSVDLAKKVACDRVTVISPRMAFEWEVRTGGEIRYQSVMRWVYQQLSKEAA